jgi:hypothetical protein
MPRDSTRRNEGNTGGITSIRKVRGLSKRLAKHTPHLGGVIKSKRSGWITLPLIACATGCTTTHVGPGHSRASPVTVGDVTVANCVQDASDSTQVDVSGSILNHSAATSDYSFVVTVLNGSTPATRTGVTQDRVLPGLVATWSSTATIGGSTSGTFTCHLSNVIRTPSRP